MARVRNQLIPAWLALTNRVFNPIQRLWAPWLPPFALIVHRGRRTGTEYRTPVLAWRSGSTLYVGLYYGTRVHWVRNLVAAGGGEVVRRGRRDRIVSVRIDRRRALPVLVAELAPQRA
jgi:deazaflavin-dependent oxidoreductase (nitroreductase family)